MRKKLLTLIILSVFLLSPFNFSQADSGLASRLKGRILLQVEEHGEAWYINPANERRYYMANGEEAYNIMRNLGIGITNKDLEKIKSDKTFAKKNSGKIFLQVEENGEAYYINIDGIAHYLKNGEEAYNIMRDLGLGITNKDLNTILKNGQVDTSQVKELSNSEIISHLKDSVVYIETTQGSGSGFIIDSVGYVLTNAHVVEDVSKASVILSNGTTLSATVIGRDENIDLALLKVVKSGLKEVALGDSDGVNQGDEIFTLGYPFGIKGDVSFKEGTISRTLRGDDYEYFETSADIHPGNSGGPLVNRYGQVVGINTAVYGESIDGVSVGETIKLAIPVNVAKGIISDLKNGRNIIKNKVVEPNNNKDSQENFQQALYKNEYNDFVNKYNRMASKITEGDNFYKQINSYYTSGSYYMAQNYADNAKGSYKSANDINSQINISIGNPFYQQVVDIRSFFSIRLAKLSQICELSKQISIYSSENRFSETYTLASEISIFVAEINSLNLEYGDKIDNFFVEANEYFN